MYRLVVLRIIANRTRVQPPAGNKYSDVTIQWELPALKRNKLLMPSTTPINLNYTKWKKPNPRAHKRGLHVSESKISISKLLCSAGHPTGRCLDTGTEERGGAKASGRWPVCLLRCHMTAWVHVSQLANWYTSTCSQCHLNQTSPKLVFKKNCLNFTVSILNCLLFSSTQKTFHCSKVIDVTPSNTPFPLTFTPYKQNCKSKLLLDGKVIKLVSLDYTAVCLWASNEAWTFKLPILNTLSLNTDNIIQTAWKQFINSNKHLLCMYSVFGIVISAGFHTEWPMAPNYRAILQLLLQYFVKF